MKHKKHELPANAPDLEQRKGPPERGEEVEYNGKKCKVTCTCFGNVQLDGWGPCVPVAAFAGGEEEATYTEPTFDWEEDDDDGDFDDDF